MYLYIHKYFYVFRKYIPTNLFLVFLCYYKYLYYMNVGEHIKKVREAKGLSQKEVAINLSMNPSQYSKIENGKVDPQFSSIEKIANALNVSIADIFNSESVFDDINSLNKSTVEKVKLIEQLDDKQKESIFTIIDMAISNKKLKNTLTNALSDI